MQDRMRTQAAGGGGSGIRAEPNGYDPIRQGAGTRAQAQKRGRQALGGDGHLQVAKRRSMRHTVAPVCNPTAHSPPRPFASSAAGLLHLSPHTTRLCTSRPRTSRHLRACTDRRCTLLTASWRAASSASRRV